MSSSDSILRTSMSERRWASEMERTLAAAHRVQIDALHSVFQVPASTRQTKPEAYAPQLMGLGPFHHLRPELYAATMNQKLAAIKELGGSDKPDIFKNVVEEVSESVFAFRDFYKEYLDLHPTTLAWILTVDGLFLFNYLKGVVEFAAGERNQRELAEAGKLARDIIVPENQIPIEAGVVVLCAVEVAAGERNQRELAEMGKLAGDILVLENQIPTELLKKIGLIYRRQFVTDDEHVHKNYVDYILNGGFLAFCQMYSPLKLSTEWKHIRTTTNQAHLLHVMYHLIVNNCGNTDFFCSESDVPYPCSDSGTVSVLNPPCELEYVDGGIQVNSMLELVFPHPRTEHGRSVRIKDKSLGHLLHHMNRLLNPNADDEVIYDGISMAAPPVAVGEVICIGGATQAFGHICVDVSVDTQTLGDVNTILGGLSLAVNLPGLSIAMNFLSALGQVPWDRITALFQKADPTEEQPSVDEVAPPTVTEMAQIAGIKFSPYPGRIKDAKFDIKEKTFFLPVITMNTHSETILRNLLAYEAALLAESDGPRLELAEYVGLLCAIIDTNKDVEILKEAKIVEGELGNYEIAAIFNELRKITMTTGLHQEMSKVENFIEEAVRQRDNVWRVKIKRNAAKYGGSCWKFIRMVITLLVVVVLLFQAFCTLFSCPRWSGNTAKLRLVFDY